MGILCICLEGALPYAHYVITSPVRGVNVVHFAQYDLARPLSWLPPKLKKAKKNTVLWWSSSRSIRRELQGCCQPTQSPAGMEWGGGYCNVVVTAG